MRPRALLAVGLFLLGFVSAWCQAPAIPSWGPRVTKNVFEVVLKKPDADPFTYQEPLPLDLLPYAERTDTQISIGTAFSIGGGRFVSAAHVFFLEYQTLREPISVRDSAGKVYPVGNIVAYSNRRDYVVFEVPGLDAPGLTLSKDYSVDSRVYAVGNAYGQGVIIRDGLLTSTTPEERKGEWSWLRFSAPASPGNSGGPLLDEAGQVIGIVLRKSENENLNYALPASELSLSPVAVEDIRDRYHLPNLTGDAPVQGATTFPLPLPVSALREKVHGFASDLALAAARTLTRDPSSLFPLAQGSEPSLGTSFYTALPKFVAQQQDGTWQAQGVEKPVSARAGDQGTLLFGSLWRYTVFSFSKQRDQRVSDLFGNPRVLMDTILKGLPWYRSISTKQVRITSFGEPAFVDHFQDSYGRTWLVARWDVPLADLSEMIFALPTPSGAVGVFVQCPYAEWSDYQFDIRFLADFLVYSYAASLSDWKDFLANQELRPRILDGVTLAYTQDSSVRVETPRLTLAFSTSLMGVTDDSRLVVLPAYYRSSTKGAWDIGSIAYYESTTSKTYCDVGKIVKPEPGASDQLKQTWAALSRDSYPFNGSAYPANGLTNFFSVHHPIINGKLVSDPPFLYAVILGIEGSPTTADAQSRFAALKSGFSVKASEEASAISAAAARPQVLSLQNGKTIFQAVASGDREAVKAFIAAKADLEIRDDDSRTALLLALRLGKKEIAADLLSAGVSVQGKDRFGATPLILALRYADPAMARALIAKGADVSAADSDGFTPLMIAMDPKFNDLPELLLAKGANVMALSSKASSALTLALFNKRAAVAREIAKRGVRLDLTDSNGWTVLMLALRYTDADTAKLLIDARCPLDGKTNDGWTPLLLAARYSTPEVVLRLLAAGAPDVDSRNKGGVTPLMMEAEFGSVEAVAALLDKGADPQAKDNQGWTPLFYALRYGDQARAQAILKRMDTLPDADSKGWTALHIAARYMPQMVPAVGSLGAGSLNARTAGGWTPLLLATENGSLEAVQWLARSGADPTLRNDDGKNALDLARAENKTDIASYLEGVLPGGQTQGAPRISLSTSGVSMFKGNTYQVVAMVTPTTEKQSVISWSSSDEKVASVDSSGLITALSPGVVSITASAGSALKAQCRVSVWAPDGNGYVQFTTDTPLAEGWWNKSFPADSNWDAQKTISVVLMKAGGDGTQGFGFQYCFQGADNYYLILINTMGEFIIQKQESGKRSTLIPWTPNASLQKGFGKANKISVVRASSDSFLVTFNDDASSRVECKDSRFVSGRVTFYVTVGTSEIFPSVPEDVRFKITEPLAYP